MDKERSRDRRAEILAAAGRVFAANGYHGASMRRIAREAGLRSPAHLYFYFEDKRALYREMIEEGVGPIREAVLLNGGTDREPVEVLAEMSRSYMEIFEQDEQVQTLRLLFAEVASDPTRASESLAASGTPMLTLIETYLAEQHEAGNLDAPDARATAIWFLWQLVAWIELKAMFPPLWEQLPDRDAYARLIAERAARALAVPSRPS